MTDDDADPFECPACGSRTVECSGGGRRDCQACPWSYRPAPERTTRQTGLNTYYEPQK